MAFRATSNSPVDGPTGLGAKNLRSAAFRQRGRIPYDVIGDHDTMAATSVHFTKNEPERLLTHFYCSVFFADEDMDHRIKRFW